MRAHRSREIHDSARADQVFALHVMQVLHLELRGKLRVGRRQGLPPPQLRRMDPGVEPSRARVAALREHNRL